MTLDPETLRAALKEAIRAGSATLVRKTVDAGADLGPDDYDEIPLMDAAICGRLPVVKLLVEEFSQDVNATSAGGATPLIRAAVGGNLEVVRYLVEHGAALDAVEAPVSVRGHSRAASTGWESHEGTALVAAAASGSLEIVRYLLDCGADPRVPNRRGHDAFENAIRYNRSQIVDLLLERLRISPQAGFLVAARLNLSQTRRFVETLGVDAAAADSQGTTALMACAGEGDYKYLGEGPHPGAQPDHVLMATYLLEHGCPVNAQNSAGETALMLAARSQQSGLVELLLQSGADPNLRDHRGKAAVDYVESAPEPPDSWENAHEAWAWEQVSTGNLRERLAAAMAAAPADNRKT